MGLFCGWYTLKGGSTAGLVSSATSGSKRPSEPSMELANPRKIDAAAPSGPPEPAKTIKVYILIY